jgi:Flp pilus assembly pilin Flp
MHHQNYTHLPKLKQGASAVILDDDYAIISAVLSVVMAAGRNFFQHTISTALR